MGLFFKEVTRRGQASCRSRDIITASLELSTVFRGTQASIIDEGPSMRERAADRSGGQPMRFRIMERYPAKWKPVCRRKRDQQRTKRANSGSAETEFALGLAVAFALGIVCLAGVTWNTAAAQSGRSFDRTPNAQAPRAPARIVVRPGRRLVRQCDSWYVVERRAAGDVLTPQMRCRWTYR